MVTAGRRSQALDRRQSPPSKPPPISARAPLLTEKLMETSSRNAGPTRSANGLCGFSIARHDNQKLVAAHAANDVMAAGKGAPHKSSVPPYFVRPILHPLPFTNETLKISATIVVTIVDHNR